jgi:hypothetical protein
MEQHQKDFLVRLHIDMEHLVIDIVAVVVVIAGVVAVVVRKDMANIAGIELEGYYYRVCLLEDCKRCLEQEMQLGYFHTVD